MSAGQGQAAGAVRLPFRLPFRLSAGPGTALPVRNRLHLIARAAGVDLTLDEPGAGDPAAALVGSVAGAREDATRFLETVNATVRRAVLLRGRHTT